MTEEQDREQVAAVVGVFFDAFTSGSDLPLRVQALREVFLPGAVVVRTCGQEPLLHDVETFLAPRIALLTDGTLEDFREWETGGRTEVHGAVASHVCTYAKSWVQGGQPVTGSGTKVVHLVRTSGGWRISAVAWDDDPAA